MLVAFMLPPHSITRLFALHVSHACQPKTSVHRQLPLVSQEAGHCVCASANEGSLRVQVGCECAEAVFSRCPRGPPVRLAAAWSDASRRRAARTAAGVGGGGCAARRHAPGRRARRHPRAAPPCAAPPAALHACHRHQLLLLLCRIHMSSFVYGLSLWACVRACMRTMLCRDCTPQDDLIGRLSLRKLLQSWQPKYNAARNY